MTNQTIEEAVEEFNELHTISITLQSGMMIGNTTEKACLDSYERLEKHFRQALLIAEKRGLEEARKQVKCRYDIDGTACDCCQGNHDRIDDLI